MTAHTLSAIDWVSTAQHMETHAGRISYRVQGDGAAVVLLHGFPTWSYDWAGVAPALAGRYRVVTLDFPGYGFSQKHGRVDFSVGAAADVVEQLLSHLGIDRANLVVHDFGGIVGQELLDRRRRGRLSFEIAGVHVLNNGIVYAAYRPKRAQRLLALPIVGRLVARSLSEERLFVGLNTVRGANKLDVKEFEELWTGIGREDGHKLAYRHIRYNAERARHHDRWEAALFDYDGPLQLIWGLVDPVSGRHVLDLARARLPHARIVELSDVGHFPQSEAPVQVAAAIGEGFA